MSTEYRIAFSIQRRRDDEDAFIEIGFGTSGAWGDLDAAVYSIESGVSHGEWETVKGMPKPESVMRDIRRQAESEWSENG